MTAAANCYRELDRLLEQVSEPIAFQAANKTGSAMVVDSPFPTFDGPVLPLPYVRISIATGSAGPFYQRTQLGRIEGVRQPGDISITLPEFSGECRVEASQCIGLALDLDATHCDDCRIIADDLAHAARGFTRDPMIASVMMALRHSAEAHGASTAFFDHGIALILNRLAMLDGRPTFHRPVRPLSRRKLSLVLDYVEVHLADDIGVAVMASIVGQERSGFTRAFQQATGFTPFAWLTRRRMDRAKEMLAADMPVTQVALAVGYTNPGKFAAAFRRWCGVPPSRWGR